MGRSAERFTLTVLLVSLAAGWTTDQSGLSMALGAFRAGLMLGATELRHQIEAAIRPFRDVLLETGDLLVLFGADPEVRKAEERLLE